MADLLAMSSSIIDEGATEAVGPINRINHELSVINDGVAVVEAFSHCVLFKTEDGLVAFDTSGVAGGERVVEAIRGWDHARLNSVIYTHGHVDHVGGCGAFIADAQQRGDPRPQVVGHENVPRRFDRYDLTNGYNLVINERQFGQFRGRGYSIGGDGSRFLPPDSARPDTTYRERLDLDVGGLQIQGRDGVWRDAVYIPGTIIINTADLVATWTNDRYCSTPHRVKPTTGGRDRYSIAYFVDPDTDTAVSAFPSCVSEDNPAKYPDTTAGAYVQRRIADSNKLTG